MKWPTFLTHFLLANILMVSAAFAEPNDGSSSSLSAPIVNKLIRVKNFSGDVPGLFVEASGDGRTGGTGYYRLGHFLGRHWLLSLRYTKFSGEKRSSGGDLESWNYVEQIWSSSSEQSFVDLTYFLTPTGTYKGGAYLSIGAGQSKDRMGYEYTRYKPFKGSICGGIFGSCDLSVEEADGGSHEFTQTLYSVSAGYLWTIFIGYPGLTLRAGANYLNAPPSQTRSFGRNRVSEVSSLRTEEFSIEAGLGIELPSWF